MQAARPAQGQASLGRHVAGDLAPDADVRAFDRRLDGGAGFDGHVAGGLQVALDVARDPQLALDLEPALQDVARAETDDIVAAVLRAGRLNRGFFSLSHGFLHRFFHTVLP